MTAAEVVVYADVVCPFAHVGLRRLVAERARRRRTDAVLHVRAWPLELVNGEAVKPDALASEVDDLRRDVAPELFVGFEPGAVPATTLPALALTAAGYGESAAQGEAVALELRTLLFEQGRDIGSRDVLAEVARRFDVPRPRDLELVRAQYEAGRALGVVGSPHFFVGGTSRFCPTLDIRHEDGRLSVRVDAAAFADLADACFG